MTQSRLRLKVLCLCAVVVGVMSFTSVAQAEPKAFWLVNGAVFGAGLLPTVVAETDTVVEFLTVLAGKSIHIQCTSTKLVGGHLVEPLAQILGKFLFHGCNFYQLLTPGGVKDLLPACKPSTGGIAGLIETFSLTGLIKLHGGVGTLEFKPTNAGGLVANISLSEECALGEKIKIEGVLSLIDTAFSTNALKHLFQEQVALTNLTINGGVSPLIVDGGLWLSLSGAHLNLTFAGAPA